MSNGRQIQAAFFDVDGTLLSFDTHRVAISTIDAFSKLKDKGIKIFIATGRPATNLKEISMLPYDGVIAMNGTDITLRSGAVISHHAIPEDVFNRFLAAARRYDVAVSVEGDDGIFVDKITPRVEEISRKVAMPLPAVVDLRKVFVPGVTSQLCLFSDTGIEQKIMAEFPGLSATRWCDIFADINIAGIDKGTGLREVCDYYGIDSADTIAFGDGGNDIPMLRAAGIGVAMGNAGDLTKAAADYVTSPVDADGISSALHHLAVLPNAQAPSVSCLGLAVLCRDKKQYDRD